MGSHARTAVLEIERVCVREKESALEHVHKFCTAERCIPHLICQGRCVGQVGHGEVAANKCIKL